MNHKHLFIAGLLLHFLFFSEALLAQKSKIDDARSEFEKFMAQHPFNTRPHLSKKQLKSIPKRDRPDLANQHNFLMTLDPTTGRVPREKAAAAYKYTKQLLEGKAAIPGVTWAERGPNNVGGRTRAVMFDPNDATHKKIWAGGVAGGMWYNNDVTDANSTWHNVDDFWANMVVSCIAYDPSNTQVFYVGTGEGYFNADAIRGDGIWKTTNGGATWAQLPSTSPGVTPSLTDFPYVTKLVVNSSGHIFAATRGEYADRGGIMRSTDGGSTWTKVLSPRLSGTLTGAFEDAAADIEIGSNGTLYASFGIYTMGQIFRSSDNGNTWTNISPDGTGMRIELAVAPSASSSVSTTVIYAVAHFENGDNDVKWFKKSVNGGATWSDLPIPRLVDDNTTHFTRGQAFYDLIITVNPTDPNIVLLGGIDVHKSINGGTTWTGVSHWYGGFSKPQMHSDQHAIVYRPGSSSEVVIGNDGGIYYSPDAGSSATPSFEMRNKNYNVTQFYSCAAKNVAASSYFIAGAQDNGTQKFTTAGIGSTSEVSGGDGAFCFIDQDNPLYQLSSYTYNDVYRSVNGGESFVREVNDQNRGKFINPSDYDNAANILYSCGNVDELIRYSGITGTISITNIAMTQLNGVKISAIKANNNSANRLFIGSEGGRVFRMDNANGSPVVTRIDNGTTPITTVGYVSCIDVGATDNEIIVTYSNYNVKSIWYTSDGGANWVSKDETTHGLPDMPVRWVLFNPENTQQVLLATEVGVWSTSNISAANPGWQPTVNSLANIRCDMLQYRTSDRLIAIATHGRGLYTTDVFSQPTAEFSSDNTLGYQGMTVQFNDGSLQATSWAWNFGDGGTSTLKNPSHVYNTPGKFNVTLVINGGASTITKSNLIHILPTKSVPYLAADGGNFEVNVNDFASAALSGGINIWERGTPTNALTTVSSGTNAWKTDLDADITKATYQCALITPNFNLSNTINYTVRFRKSMEFYYNNAPFAVQLHYSLDKGETWTRLGTDNDPNGVNWYERGPSSAAQINASIFEDRMGWLASSNNALTSYNISFLAGNPNVAFMFVLSVEDGYDQIGYDVDGFMIDDFEVVSVDCSVTGLPFTETFENASFPPSCWSVYNGANGLGTQITWSSSDTLAHAGSKSASVRFENVTGGTAQDWLVTRKIALAANSNSLTFWQRQAWTQNYGTSYSVKISTTSPTNHASFTNLATFDETTFSTTFSQKTIDLSAYNGQQVYIAFVMEQDDGDNWYIDDISITGTGTVDITPPTVSASVVQNASPSSLSVTFSENVTATSASGFTLSGTTGSITGFTGSGTSTLTFSLSAPVISGQTLTLSYNSAQGNVKDMATTPNSLASFNNLPVTNNVQQAAPTASTGAASSVTASAATISGSVNANGASTTVTFEYGTTTSYGSSVSASPGTVTGSTSAAVSASLSGLSGSTTYHFRVKAVNSGGTTYGSDATFTTSAAGTAPVADFSANNTIITAGGSVNFTDLSTNSPTTWSWTFNGGSPSTSAVQNPTGIVYSTAGTYSVTLTASNSFGNNSITKTNYITVNIASSQPTATGSAATLVTETSATLNGAVNANNASTIVSFEYGPTTSYGTVVSAVPSTVTGNTVSPVSANITSLTPATLYHYRVKAVNSNGTTYSGDMNFTTLTGACNPPTTQASNFTVTPQGNNAVINWVRGSGTGVIVVLKASGAVNSDPVNGTNYNANAAFGTGDQIGTGNFVVYKGSGTTVTVTGLNPLTTYHVAIYEF